MIVKRCPRCGRKIPEGKICPVCGQIKREYPKTPENKKEYHTTRWLYMTRAVMSRYDNADQLILSEEHRLVPADTVHHIIPTSEAPDRWYDTSNLIPLSRESHQRVHEAYRAGGQAKESMQAKLFSLVKAFD